MVNSTCVMHKPINIIKHFITTSRMGRWYGYLKTNTKKSQTMAEGFSNLLFEVIHYLR